MTLAIDASNFSGEISAVEAAALYAAGVRRAIVQTVNPTVLTHRQQIPSLLAVGIEVEAYVYLWMTDDVTERIRWANAELRPFNVKLLWLDCEDVTPGLSTGQAVTAIQTARREALLPCGIYTGQWWWDAHMGGWEGCADLPLWVAQYDGQQDTNLAAPFGGWTGCAMKQYQGDVSLGGVPALDLDWYEEAEMVERQLSDSQKVALGVALGGTNGVFARHFSELAGGGLADGYDVTLGDDPAYDVVIFKMPRGTLPPV